MKTSGQLRYEQGMKLAANEDSLYKVSSFFAQYFQNWLNKLCVVAAYHQRAQSFQLTCDSQEAPKRVTVQNQTENDTA